MVPLDDLEALEAVLARHGHEICAVAIEPLPANYGLLEQKPEYLRNVEAAAKRIGALWLLDEVISGFRVGLTGMAGRMGLKPDLVGYGKVLGGGFNVAAYGGRSDLLDLVAPSGKVYQAGTLSANPVGMKAGLTTLQRAEQLGLWETLQSRTRDFCSSLNRGFSAQGSPWQVDSMDSIFWLHRKSPSPIRSITAIPSDQKESYARLFHRLLDLGVYLPPSGYEVGFVSLAHTPEILAETVQKILEAAKES